MIFSPSHVPMLNWQLDIWFWSSKEKSGLKITSVWVICSEVVQRDQKSSPKERVESGRKKQNKQVLGSNPKLRHVIEGSGS